MKLSPFDRRVLRNFHEGREATFGLQMRDLVGRLPGTLVKLGRDGLIKGEELTDAGREKCNELFELKRKLWAYCHDCGSKWVALNLPIPLSEAGEEMRGRYDCPNCGGVGRLTPKEEKPT